MRRDAQGIFAQADVDSGRTQFLMERRRGLWIARGDAHVGAAPFAILGRGQRAARAGKALDDFIEVVKSTCELAYTNPAEALKAPVNTVVGKLDEAKAAHPKTICLSWRKLCQLVAE